MVCTAAVVMIWHLLLLWGARALLTLLRIVACMGHQSDLLTTGPYKPSLSAVSGFASAHS
jgi:hypothetical protein